MEKQRTQCIQKIAGVSVQPEFEIAFGSFFASAWYEENAEAKKAGDAYQKFAFLVQELSEPKAKAEGGEVDTVPIVAAGGEYVIHPRHVVHIGNGSLEDGHKILDEFVNRFRAKTVKTLKNLPPPKKN